MAWQDVLGGAANWWFGPQSFLQQGAQAGAGALNSVGQGVFSGAQQGANFLTGVRNPFDPTYSPYPENMTPQELDQVREHAIAGGVGGADLNQISSGIYRDPYSASAAGNVYGAYGQESGPGGPTGVFGDIANYERQGRGVLNNLRQDEQRYRMLANDPNAVRSDVEYGKMLRDAESQLSTYVQGVRRDTAQRSASRGIGFSGRALQDVGQAEQFATTGRLNAIGDLRRQAQDQYNQSRQQGNQYQDTLSGNVLNARSGARTGRLNDLNNVLGNAQGYRYGAQAANEGQHQQAVGNALGVGNLIAGVGQQAMQPFQQLTGAYLGRKLG